MSALASSFGVYNSSQTTSTLPYTYNFCNAPHVNSAHYELNTAFTSTGGGQLIHLPVIMLEVPAFPFLFFIVISPLFAYLASKR